MLQSMGSKESDMTEQLNDKNSHSLIVVLIAVSLMSNEVEHLFICLSLVHIPSLVKRHLNLLLF